MRQSEFARHCHVSPPAIARAIKSRRIKVSANGLIDTSSAKNVDYMQHQIDRKSRTAKGKSEEQLYAKRTPEYRGRVQTDGPDELEGDDLDPLDIDLGDGPDELDAPRPRGRPRAAPPPQQPPQPNRNDVVEDARVEIDYAIEKMRSATALNKARLAAMVKATIRKDFVDQVISLIGTSISDHLITLGDRISPDLAAMAGSTEASVVRQIKQALDEDISAALHEMQRVVADRYQRQLEEE